MVSWRVTREDSDLISAIVERAVNLDSRLDQVQTMMDLTAAHANGNPLRLAEMLAAPQFDLMHDVYGINQHLDRNTGKLTGCFTPRFNASITEVEK